MYRTINYCSVKDCSLKVHAKMLCNTHYRRMQRHGHTEPTTEFHGLRSSKEYNSWAAMLTRCYNENFSRHKWYKGIEVHPEWRTSFKAFYDYVGPKPDSSYSLDRIDSSKGYIPGNVRWANWDTQVRNRRMQSSNKSGYRGVHKDGNRWCASISTIYIGRYIDVEQAAIAYDCAAIQLYGDEAKPNIL